MTLKPELLQLFSTFKKSIIYTFFLIFKVTLCLTILIYTSINFTKVKDSIGYALQLTLLFAIVCDLVVRFFSSNIFFSQFTNVLDLILCSIFTLLILLSHIVNLSQNQLSFKQAFTTLLLSFILTRGLLEAGANICKTMDTKNIIRDSTDYNTNNVAEIKKPIEMNQIKEEQYKYKYMKDEITFSGPHYFQPAGNKNQSNLNQNHNIQQSRIKTLINSNKQEYEKFSDQIDDGL